MPDELFQPYAAATTSILMIEKGIPHPSTQKTAFVRLRYDGFTLKKGTHVERLDGRNEIPQALSAIANKEESAGFSGMAVVSGDSEWTPGAYIKPGKPEEADLKVVIDMLFRRLSSFYIRYAAEIVTQREVWSCVGLVDTR